jgi:hypothetical protein
MSMDSIPPSKDTIWQKEDMIICCLQETYLIDRNKHWFRVKHWKRLTKPMAPEKRQE